MKSLEVFTELIFVTFGVTYVIIDDLAFGIEDKHMRDTLDVHGAFEIAIRVEKRIVFPAVTFYEGFHFMAILRLIDRNDVHLHNKAGLSVGEKDRRHGQ